MSDNILFKNKEGKDMMEQLGNGEVEIKDTRLKKQVEENLNGKADKDSNPEDGAK